VWRPLEQGKNPLKDVLLPLREFAGDFRHQDFTSGILSATTSASRGCFH
jgi:hypothetical protein